MTNQSGIYCITNTVNGHKYIGQSVNLSHRWIQHLHELRHNKHGNDHLNKAFNKYGEESFNFAILMYCEKFELTRYEQAFVDVCNPEYNIQKICVDSKFGMKASDELRKKLSEAHAGKPAPHKGHPLTKEHIEKLRQANIGKHANLGLKWNEERKQKHSERMKLVVHESKPVETKRCEYCGKEFKPEKKSRRFCSIICSNTNKNISRRGVPSWNKGIPATEEEKERLRQMRLGKQHSEETKQKMRESQQRRRQAEAAKKMEVNYAAA